MGKPKLTIDDVRRICLEHGWVLISTEYLNTISGLEMMCENGHINTKNVNHVKEGRGCKACRSVAERKNFAVVKAEALKLGITILGDSYEDAHTKIPFVCERGHYGEKSWHSIRKGFGCRQCSFENKVGKGNPNYNHNLSDELRGKQRNFTEYYEWRRGVLKRDGYTCRCCGVGGGKLEVHHILNYAEHPLLQIDVSNGATMCAKDHKAFHKIYGRKNNTREQFEEYCAKFSKV